MSSPAIHPFVWADYFETGFDDVHSELGKLLGTVMLLLALVVSMVMLFGHDNTKDVASAPDKAMVEQAIGFNQRR